MAFTPKKSLTESDEREAASIELIKSLLVGCGVKTQLLQGEKGANIDGYIELLDRENRINGKITAQVKTVPPTDEGKFTFDCTTSFWLCRKYYRDSVADGCRPQESDSAMAIHIPRVDRGKSVKSRATNNYIQLY